MSIQDFGPVKPNNWRRYVRLQYLAFPGTKVSAPGQLATLPAPTNAGRGGDGSEHSDDAESVTSCEIETVPETEESWRQAITQKRDTIVGTKLREVRIVVHGGH